MVDKIYIFCFRCCLCFIVTGLFLKMVETNFLSRETGYSWCETNYLVTNSIAEFVNTVSSLPIVIFPLINWFLTRPFSDRNPAILVVHFQIAFVGIASAYYHATLSLLGQLVDEVAILWVIVGVFCIWLPVVRCLPVQVTRKVKEVRISVLCFATFATLLAFVKPAVNSLALLALGIPLLIFTIWEGIICGLPEIWSLMLSGSIYYVLAIVFWILDWSFCDLWRAIHFPYLHAIFHLFISYSVHSAFIMFLYLDVLVKAPEFEPRIRYFPRRYPCFVYMTLSNWKK